MKIRGCYIAMMLVVVAARSEAAQRLQAESVSCDHLHRTIEAAGSVLVQARSKSGNQLYDLYVRDEQFCHVGEVVETAYLPSSDRGSCPVKRCVYYPNRP